MAPQISKLMATLICTCVLHMYISRAYTVSVCYVGCCLHVLQGHIGVVRCICLMGDRLVSAGDCKKVMVWNVKVSTVEPHLKDTPNKGHKTFLKDKFFGPYRTMAI